MNNINFASELAWNRVEGMRPNFLMVSDSIGKAIHNDRNQVVSMDFQQLYELIGMAIHSDWKAIPEKFIIRLAVRSNNKNTFIDWLIDSGHATCKDSEARKQLTEIKARMEALHKRRVELECTGVGLGNIMRGEYSNIYLGIESDFLAYNPAHSEQFNDVKHLLWLSMQEREDLGYMVDEEASESVLYEMNMDLFNHIKKMFPEYIEQLMLPGVDEYEQVIAEQQSVIQKYDDAYTLTSITLSDGRTLEVGGDWILSLSSGN